MFCSMHSFINKAFSLMSLLFKIQKTFSHFWPKLWEMQKGTWYHKILEECGEIREIKIHMWMVWLLACSHAFFSPVKTWEKGKVQVPQWNEMLSLYFTALGFISKNEEYKLEKT